MEAFDVPLRLSGPAHDSPISSVRFYVRFRIHHFRVLSLLKIPIFLVQFAHLWLILSYDFMEIYPNWNESEE
jgi:hypothetical protein